jgi:ferritin
MIKKSLEKALNEQITREIYSSLLYLSMAGFYTRQNLSGFANWMNIQAKEEMDHALKFFHFLLDRGGETQIGAMEAPKNSWATPLEAFEAAYKHELYITENINNLADLAITEKDHATNNLIQWFINEQVEEEAQVDEIVNKLKMMEGFPGGLIMMDNELKQRAYTPPATNAE